MTSPIASPPAPAALSVSKGAGVIAWEMNAACGYRCTYCPVPFVDERVRWAADLPRLVAFFAGLSGAWELWLTGGEPMLNPDLPRTVGGLAEAGRAVSIETNLSATVEQYRAVAVAAGSQAATFSASLHLEYVDPDAFLSRLLAVAEHWAGRVRVTCVATRQTLFRLPALVASYRAADVPLLLQAQRIDGRAIGYAYDELAVLLQHGGHEGIGRVELEARGRICASGLRYLLVDHRADVWRCGPARSERGELLGNLLDGSFAFFDEAKPCAYDRCHCATPIQRGLVARR